MHRTMSDEVDEDGVDEDDAFNNPLGRVKIDRALRVPPLDPGSRLLDLGCGRGELLVRAAERHRAGGVGVDQDAGLIEAARRSAAARAPDVDLAFHATDATTFAVADAAERFDLTACVGGSHIFGGFAPTVRRLRGATKPGGHVLVGDVYWRRDPPDEYLEVLGSKRSDHSDHAGTAAAGVGEGLTLVYTAVASEDDWDHFEGRFWSRRLRAASEAGDEPAVARVRAWQDAYLLWGRQTMGFGLYLFRRA